ncbi:MAG: IclR family transcriptional regulator [Firmicutes bacterium]|nr:IclR family transcriptional regulator [Bacillota bacterium]
MQATDRLVAILEAIAQSPEGAGVTEVSDRVGLPRSTVHRALNSLVDHRLAAQDPSSRKYRLGMGILRLASTLLEGNNLIAAAQPVLEDIRRDLQETVFLAVMDGAESICVAKVDGVNPLRYFVEIGRVLPFHCSASVKAMLAYAPAAMLDDLLSKRPLVAFTPRTKVNPDEYRREIKQVQERGYALCLEEFESGVNAMAVPVFGARGRPVASITIVGPASRLDASFMNRAVPRLRQAASDMSRALAGMRA